MNEPREPFGGRRLIASGARQFRLDASLLVNDRGDKGGDGFDLMPMRERAAAL